MPPPISVPQATFGAAIRAAEGAPPWQPRAAARLSNDQWLVYCLAMTGNSLFFTGRAGAGKTFLLRVLIDALRRRHGRRAVAVTASTGVAAEGVRGSTIHRWAAIGLGADPAPKLAAKLLRNRAALRRVRGTRVLIIDEVSMLTGELIDKIDAVMCKARDCSLPFGGLQVIATGDFNQLPPVVRGAAAPPKPLYAFDAAAWKRAMKHHVLLDGVFRQKDPAFLAILEQARRGAVDAAALAALAARVDPAPAPRNGVVPTRLYPHRATVAHHNSAALEQLAGEEHTYAARDSETKRGTLQRLGGMFRVAERVALRPRAQVMLLQNAPLLALANGSLGVVERFTTPAAWDGGADAVVGELEPGQQWPVVRFARRGGPREVAVGRAAFPIEEDGEPACTREQLPLALAYAWTVHKAQGMTLECVHMDLYNVFERGQAYVALSRATSLDGVTFAAPPTAANFRPVEGAAAFERERCVSDRAAKDALLREADAEYRQMAGLPPREEPEAPEDPEDPEDPPRKRRAPCE